MTVRELELRLEVSRDAEHHDAHAARAVELPVRGTSDQCARFCGEARKGQTTAGVPVHNPE